MNIQPGSTLLLVDDQPEMGVIVAHHCRRTDWHLDVAYDVPAAWERLQSQRFDLVLLDMNLPRERGDQLCRRLSADRERMAQPVALFTGWGLPNDLVAGLDAGAKFIVAKEVVRFFDDWIGRVGEILEWVRGRKRPPLLQMKGEPMSSPESGEEVGWLVRALRHTSLRSVPPEVKTWILRHAWTNVLKTPVPTTLNAWLSPSVRPEAAWPRLSPDDVRALCDALADQVWCLLGTAASAPFRALLAGTFPGVSDTPPP